jgi:hypothetical protein
MKSFGKYLEEAAAELPLAPDDVLNAIARLERLKTDENTPNHVYSFYTLPMYFGVSTGHLFTKGCVSSYIGKNMDEKTIAEVIASAKEYQKVATAWKKEAADIIKRYGGKAGLEGKYRTYVGPLKAKSLEEIGTRADGIMAVVKKGLTFWKTLKAIAAMKAPRREFGFEDDIVHVYDIKGKEVAKGSFDKVASSLKFKTMFDKSVYCEKIRLYVISGPTAQSGLPSAKYIMTVEE